MKLKDKLKSVFFHKSCFIFVFFSFFLFALNLFFSISLAYPAEVTLSWDPNQEQNLGGYKLYYKTGTSGIPYDGSGAVQGSSGIAIPIGDLNEPSIPQYRLTGLDDNKDYFFVVTAFNVIGKESDYSNEVIYRSGSDLESPSVPSGLSGSVISPIRIDLTWNVSIDTGGSGLAGYRVYRDGIKVAETPVPNYSDIGLIEFTQYTYLVTAYDNNNNESAPSDPITVTTQPPETRNIVASAGENGSISPSGTITVNYGADQAFTITPDANCHVVDVLVDGVSVGPVTSYTFTGVTANHTISASFALKNHAPLTNAGPDQNVPEGVTVKLSGANSIDLDDGIASSFWEQIGGVNVDLSNPSEIETSFIAPIVSSYGEALLFRLTATDYAGSESSDYCIVNVSWANIPPVADAGPDKTADEGITIFLDAINSIDTDDGIVTYQWNQVAGTPVILSDSSDVQPSFITPYVGAEGESLKFELTVIDNGGLQSRDTCIVNVTWQNMPPVAKAGEDQTVYSGSTVILDAFNSLDSDGGIALYYWTQIAGSPVIFSDSTGVQASFTAPNTSIDGEALIFNLTITDDNGLKHSDTCKVNVNALKPIGDIDGDGKIDCNDYFKFAAAYGSCIGERKYLPSADPDGDGCITEADRDILFPLGVKICDLSAQKKNRKVRLAWSHVGADNYNIYRKIEGENYTFLTNIPPDHSTYLDMDVVNGETYYYVVTGECNGLEGDNSNEVIVTPQPPGKK